MDQERPMPIITRTSAARTQRNTMKQAMDRMKRAMELAPDFIEDIFSSRDLCMRTFYS